MKTEKPKKLIRWYILGAIGAVLTILAAGIVVPALPYLLSFAAGAMLYVVGEELIPEMTQGQPSNVVSVLFAIGFSVMMLLDVALGYRRVEKIAMQGTKKVKI